MADDAAKIIEICEREWPDAKDDCSKFVKAVAGTLGITLTGDANSIVDQIVGAGWTRLADGRAAAQQAALGSLVIGGLKGSDQEHPSAHGHVVVVVKGPLNRDKYPSAYWGQLGGVGKENETINWSWRSGDRDRVIYGARTPAATA
jgi:hypothetical protein